MKSQGERALAFTALLIGCLSVAVRDDAQTGFSVHRGWRNGSPGCDSFGGLEAPEIRRTLHSSAAAVVRSLEGSGKASTSNNRRPQQCFREQQWLRTSTTGMCVQQTKRLRRPSADQRRSQRVRFDSTEVVRAPVCQLTPAVRRCEEKTVNEKNRVNEHSPSPPC